MEFSREIMEEFFMRLPVKLLTRLKCVSKGWNDLISNPSFRKRYQSQQQTKCSASTGFICFDREKYKSGECYNLLYGDPGTINFLYTSEKYVEKKELKSLNYLKRIGYVVAASKSLLLLCYDPEILYIYDLVFKKGHILPTTPGVGDHVSFGFKFEAKQAAYYDDSRLYYTVVCVDIPHASLYTASSIYNVKIYSSESGAWRNSVMRAKPSTTFRLQPKYVAKVIGGVFHWHEPCFDRIIAYDSEDPTGRAVLIEHPPAGKFDRNGRERLKALEGRKDGSLQFIGVEDMIVSVWIMRNTSGQNYMDEDIVDVSRWSLACRVNIQDIGISAGSYGKNEDFIGVDPADADVIYLRSWGFTRALS